MQRAAAGGGGQVAHSPPQRLYRCLPPDGLQPKACGKKKLSKEKDVVVVPVRRAELRFNEEFCFKRARRTQMSLSGEFVSDRVSSRFK